MATPEPKVLRIGIIQGGKIVEERLVRKRQPVTIGSEPRNTIVVPQSNLPASFTVFLPQGDRYQLAFAEGAAGRVQGAGGDADLADLVRQGVARKQGDSYLVPLRGDEHGKVALGEVTLLWQFVVPPPEAPRPVLPRAARGNHFQSMDKLFVFVLTLSLALHVSAYVVLGKTPPRDEVTLEEIPDRFAKLLIPERKPEPPKKREEEKKAVAKPEEPKAQPEKKAGGEEAKLAQSKAARALAVQQAVRSKGILRVLGALGPGTGPGAVADVFGPGTGFGDVASALSGASGVAVATDPSAGGGRRGGGQVGKARIGDLATSGGGGAKVGYGAKSEARVSAGARVSGSVAAEVAEIDSADVDQGKLGAFVRARIGLIKACYESQLKRNPGLKGKIRIRFTILATGALAEIQVVENSLGSGDVASCIVGTMRSWRTPFRPAGTVTVEYPFVFSAS